MKIYVASSWRNEKQPEVVSVLRDSGHDVYDFRNPRQGNNGFHWSQIDPNWRSWTPGEYLLGLQHPLSVEGFSLDMNALSSCECVVAVQPFGRSASLELGWACGAGRYTILLLDSGEPELMVKMCSAICTNMFDVLRCLESFDRMTPVSNAKYYVKPKEPAK